MVNTNEEGTTEAPVGGSHFSVAGCTTQALVTQTIEDTKEFQNTKCIMEAVEANTAFTIPQGSFGYYELLMPAHEFEEQDSSEEGAGSSANENVLNEPKIMLAKVGVVNEMLQLSLCEQSEVGIFKQNMHFTAGITAEGLFETQMMNEYRPRFNNNDDNNLNIPNVPARSFLRAVLESDKLEAITADKPVILEAKFKHGPNGGRVNVTVGRDENDNIFNRVMGTHQFGAPGTGYGYGHHSAVGQYNAEGGCTSHRARGTNPAKTVAEMLPPGPSAAFMGAAFAEAGYDLEDEVCWIKVNPQDMATANFPDDYVEAAVDGFCDYEDVGFECYTFADNAEGDVEASVSPFDTADYHDLVGTFGEELNDQAPVPVIEFLEADGTLWDCTAPAGVTVQPINFVGNMALGTAVEACHEEFGGERRSEMQSCFEQRNQKDAEAKAGEGPGNGSGPPPPVGN